jgi:hypothetical protein
MTQADSVLSTPPTNTPVDTTRRRFLAVAAFASAAGAGSLAAAAMAPNDVPKAVIVPSGSGADPIYAVIERHRKASAEHIEAVRIEFAFEEAHDIEGEQREEYERLYAASGTAYDEMDDAGCDLVNTRPTTLAGILALCRYIKPLFGETDTPNLPDHIEYADAAAAFMPEAFAHVIGRAIEELMKVPAGKVVLS